MSIEKDEGAVVEAAAHLLANRHRHGTEGNVQSDVEALLRAMQVGTIESHYQVGIRPGGHLLAEPKDVR